MTALLFALLLQNGPPAADSESALKARKELEQLRATLDRMMALRERAQRIDQGFRAGGDVDKLKELAEERQKVISEFEKLRTGALESANGLVASTAEALKKAPGDAGLLEVRSDTLLLLGRKDDALPELERLSELRAEDMDLAMRVGRLQHDLNRYESAIRSVRRHLDKDAKHVESRFLLGLCYFATHRFEEATGLLEGILKEEILAEQREQAQLFLKMAKSYSDLWKSEQAIRAKEEKADDLPRVKLTTSKGEIEIELFENEAPNTVANFVELVAGKFYDGLVFHRVIPNFMVQGGDPEGSGRGGPGYRFKDELGGNYRRHFRGSISMANSGPDTNGSQFFITHLPPEWLNGKHTVFGRVLQGQDIVDRLRAGDKIEKAEVLRKRDHEYKVKKMD